MQSKSSPIGYDVCNYTFAAIGITLWIGGIIWSMVLNRRLNKSDERKIEIQRKEQDGDYGMCYSIML